jgi:hypothetical protein
MTMSEYPAVMTIDQILDQREKLYGRFPTVAAVSQEISKAMRTQNWDSLPAYQREALELIANKMARIVASGNASYEDSWVDISGYAELVLREMRK